jgi:hypothetical protein
MLCPLLSCKVVSVSYCFKLLPILSRSWANFSKASQNLINVEHEYLVDNGV